MDVTDDLLKMLNDVPIENGRYVITVGMNPELKELCKKINSKKDEREQKILERRRIKRSMGL